MLYPGPFRERGQINKMTAAIANKEITEDFTSGWARSKCIPDEKSEMAEVSLATLSVFSLHPILLVIPHDLVNTGDILVRLSTVQVVFLYPIAPIVLRILFLVPLFCLFFPHFANFLILICMVSSFEFSSKLHFISKRSWSRKPCLKMSKKKR
jgi:hypothetical protein